MLFSSTYKHVISANYAHVHVYYYIGHRHKFYCSIYIPCTYMYMHVSINHFQLFVQQTLNDESGWTRCTTLICTRLGHALKTADAGVGHIGTQNSG